MKKSTMLIIGCLILLAAIPIGVLALTASGTDSAGSTPAGACGACAGCGSNGACVGSDCTCPDGTECPTTPACTAACRPAGCSGAAASCCGR